MRIPLGYIARNLWARRLTTCLTAAGLALVVFVFATVLMLDEGLRTTMVTTGETDNVVLIRRSAETEVQSAVARDQASVATSAAAVALWADGQPMASKETVVLISLTKRGSDKPSNVIIRGAGPLGLTLRPQIKLVKGRKFRCSKIVRPTPIQPEHGAILTHPSPSASTPDRDHQRRRVPERELQ